MITLRPARERGTADYGWLQTAHSFSFADYYDPAHMGFRVLRVLNEDRVAPGQGFGRHSHRDMEILSYVLQGALEHRDSLGNGSIIRPGDVRRMSAGTGVVHSERNPSSTEPVHFLQIWIEPRVLGLAPGYEQKHFDPESRRGRLRLVASPDGRDGSLTIHQDAELFVALLEPGEAVTHRPRAAWVQAARGEIDLNRTRLAAGDGAAVEDEPQLRIEARTSAEILLFDLP